jgi:hypothetical protein
MSDSSNDSDQYKDVEPALIHLINEAFSCRGVGDKLREEAFEGIKNYIGLSSPSKKHDGDKETVINLVSKNAHVLRTVQDVFKNDKDVVLAAVQKNGLALQYASEQLRNDREIVLKAVTENGYALQYASDKRKDDKEVVFAAIGINYTVLSLASDRLRFEIIDFLADNYGGKENA